MKVQVLVRNAIKGAAADIAVDATVCAGDTAFILQERVASMTNTFIFPEQKLLYNGKEISTTQRLSDCGVKDGDVLEFSFRASEQTIVAQLSDLLGQLAMSPEELGMLYSYRFALSVEDALKALGNSECKFRDFLESQKCFALDRGLVQIVQASDKVLQPSTGLSPIQEDKPHGPIEVRFSAEIQVAGGSPEPVSHDDDDEVCSLRLEAFDTVARAKEIIAASEQIPFAGRDLMLCGKKLKDEVLLRDAGVTNGDLLVLRVLASEACLASQLEELLRERTALSPNDLGLLYCQRFGTPVSQALRILRLPSSLRRFLEGHTQFSIVGGCVILAGGPKLVMPPPRAEEHKEDESRAPSAFDRVVNVLRDSSFLNIDRVEKGLNASGEASATVFIKGLPPSGGAPLLKGLQKAMVFGLESVLGGGLGVCTAVAAEGAVEVRIEGSQPICLRLAAVQ